jgi:hypothetical protein
MNQSYVYLPSGVRTFSVPLQNSSSSSEGTTVNTIVSATVSDKEYSYKLDGSALGSMVSSGQLANASYDENSTFYFVITSVMYDPTLGQVVESPFSPEVSGRFLTFAAVYTEMPERNRDQVVASLTQRMFGANKNVNLMPTSVYKDFLDPISEEFADYYVIQDFYAQTESIRSLVQFDDANGDGVSDPVDTSTKKSRLKVALKISDSTQVQKIIDSFFDKRAANHDIVRMKATPSQGKALMFVSDIPKEGLTVNDGAVVTTGPGFGVNGTPVKFVVLGTRKIYYSERTIFYNTVTQRYELEVDISGFTAGSLGNVPAGAITQVISGADPRFRVTSLSPTYGGTDFESNLSLANRTQLAISGLDTGTRGGYLLKTLGVPGVRSAQVVQANDPLMLRDIDPDTGRHLGGKVDIYVESDIVGEKQDLIAFSYNGPAGANAGETFYVEDASGFLIRTSNPLVTPATPIFELVKVVNVTLGKSYDTAGAVLGLGDGDSIQLAQNTTNLSIGMSAKDVIEVDYRYRGSNVYVLDNQPVESVVSVVGDIDGTLPPESFKLVKLEDPLQLGNSTHAHDGVAITFFNGFPTESTRQVTAEEYVFISTQPIRLAKKGVDTDTIVVSSDTNGIYKYQLDIDFTIGRGGQAGFTYLFLQPYSKIRSGSTVYVSYQHSQNLTVTYTVNDALKQVQTTINGFKHGVADAVIKGCTRNYVDISLQVIREKGYSSSKITSQIQTVLGNYISSLRVGQGVNTDDVINMVKNITGVKTLVLPIQRMMKTNGSFIQKDYIGITNFRVYSVNAGRGVTSFITVNPVLNYGTIDGGGDTNRFRAVYEGEQALITADSPLDVSKAQGRSYILADGRIIVSTTDGTPPQTKEYHATYYTYVAPGSEFAADIATDSTESLIVGSDSIQVDATAETP